MPSTAKLATTAGLTTVGNKIRSVNYLIKKTHYDTEIKDISNKYATRSDYNKFRNNIFDKK